MGGGWTALCPAPGHGSGKGDHDNSLSIGVGGSGKILLNCFGGCRIEDIVKALGLEMRDLFPDGGAANSPKRGITLAELAQHKGLPVEFLRELGIKEKNGQVYIFYGSDYRERVRTALSAHGSYWSKRKGQVDRPVGPYGSWNKFQSGQLILVEGESDCWTLWHNNFSALGVPGSKTRKRGHARPARKKRPVSAAASWSRWLARPGPAGRGPVTPRGRKRYGRRWRNTKTNGRRVPKRLVLPGEGGPELIARGNMEQ